MQIDWALPIMVDPAAFMLAAAALIAGFAVHQFRGLAGTERRQSGAEDALADLFQRGTLEAKVRETSLLYANLPVMRRRRRAVRDQLAFRDRKSAQSNRRKALEHVAAILRRGDRDEAAWDDIVKLVEGEGFVILAPENSASIEDVSDIAEGEIEDVLLLPAPTPSAVSRAA